MGATCCSDSSYYDKPDRYGVYKKPNEMVLENDYNQKVVDTEQRKWNTSYYEELNHRTRGGIHSSKKEDKETVTIYQF
ncbi:unnamed protein product [Moneuplotes crassus]|uniref:Uncharacterized protein n=1 Tax=Euplotes crassus TaxID=5936 RepID=A0AAD1Y472_EUPCR|nr:unnamed protein product [Moneuplotes crassus]